MPNLTNRPYTGWLEEALRFIAEENSGKIAMVCRCNDGAVATKYFGCDTEDQAAFAYYMHTDAIMGTVMANADHIVHRAEEMEAEEE